MPIVFNPGPPPAPPVPPIFDVLNAGNTYTEGNVDRPFGIDLKIEALPSLSKTAYFNGQGMEIEFENEFSPDGGTTISVVRDGSKFGNTGVPNAFLNLQFPNMPFTGTYSPVRDLRVGSPIVDTLGNVILPVHCAALGNIYGLNLLPLSTSEYCYFESLYALTEADWLAGNFLGPVQLRTPNGMPYPGQLVEIQSLGWNPLLGFEVVAYPGAPFIGASYGYFLLDPATGYIKQQKLQPVGGTLI